MGMALETTKRRLRLPTGWEPLRQPLFRALWLAALASNVGTWMHEVGADWLMTSLSTSPLLVSLVETAASLPVVLLSLAAGSRTRHDSRGDQKISLDAADGVGLESHHALARPGAGVAARP